MGEVCDIQIDYNPVNNYVFILSVIDRLSSNIVRGLVFILQTPVLFDLDLD